MSDQPPTPDMDIPTRPRKRSSRFASRVIVLRGSQAGKEFILNPGVNLFGREEGNIIRDMRVSRRHAYIQVEGEEYTLVDNQSTNGTFVNGQRISKPVLLQHGDTIRMGDTILTFKLEGMGTQDPSVIGARTPDLTNQNPGSTTILAARNSLSSPTRTDVPLFNPKDQADPQEDSETSQDESSSLLD